MRHDAYRRAAIIIASLDREAADEVIDRMPDDQARAIRNELVAIQSLNAGEQEAEIQAFLASGNSGASEQLGIPMSRLAPTEWSEPILRSSLEANSSLHDLLQHSDDQIAVNVMHERTSVVAAMACALPNDRAAGVLRLLPAKLQSRVLEQLNLGICTDPSVVDVIADRVCDRQAETDSSPRLNTGHQDALQAIMNELSSAERRQMIRDLERENPMLAQRLQAKCSTKSHDCYC